MVSSSSHHTEMAELSNITEDKTTVKQSCSAEFTEEVHGELIFLPAINIFFSFTAFLGNTLILVALHKESSLHPASKLLYRNLAITDLCVGIIVEPLDVVSWISMLNEKWNICYFASLTNFMSAFLVCTVSLFTLAALSVDRLLALVLGLRYRKVVTLRRTYLIVAAMWILSIVFALCSLIYFWNPQSHVPSRLYGTIILVCLSISLFSYTKIFITLRHNHTGQPSQAVTLNTARYRKAVYSALWVQVALFVCYLPLCITQVFIIHLKSVKFSPSVYLAKTFSFTLVFLNSSLNPLLYCWKIKEVRQAVKDTVREIYRSLTSKLTNNKIWWRRNTAGFPCVSYNF